MLQDLLAKKTVLAILGPTATGKTQLSLELAQHFPLEIISLDSALIYKGMDIGTAKPSAAEMSAVPHHLIDILDPAESYSAADFVTDAKRLVDEIHARNKIPLLVGGTMMYLNALQKGLATLPSADEALREKLQAEYLANPEATHQRLIEVDLQAGARIHQNDPQRIIRALEVYELTGKPLSQWQTEQEADKWQVDLKKVALIPEDRAALHKKIEERLDQMFEQGLVQEVEKLYQRGDLEPDMPSIRCVGYRQVWDFLTDKASLEEAQEKTLFATRQLAKRQLTWLRKEEGLLSIDPFATELKDRVVKVLSYLSQ